MCAVGALEEQAAAIDLHVPGAVGGAARAACSRGKGLGSTEPGKGMHVASPCFNLDQHWAGGHGNSWAGDEMFLPGAHLVIHLVCGFLFFIIFLLFFSPISCIASLATADVVPASPSSTLPIWCGFREGLAWSAWPTFKMPPRAEWALKSVGAHRWRDGSLDFMPHLLTDLEEEFGSQAFVCAKITACFLI